MKTAEHLWPAFAVAAALHERRLAICGHAGEDQHRFSRQRQHGNEYSRQLRSSGSPIP